MDKFTGSCKGSNLQGGIVWSGLNYLFIVNLFMYVCANDLAAAGAKAPLKRPGFFRSRPRMLGHLTHSFLKAISTDFYLRRWRRKNRLCAERAAGLEPPGRPKDFSFIQDSGEGSMQFNVQQISK